jgi:hypothetical protein
MAGSRLLTVLMFVALSTPALATDIGKGWPGVDSDHGAQVYCPHACATCGPAFKFMGRWTLAEARPTASAFARAETPPIQSQAVTAPPTSLCRTPDYGRLRRNLVVYHGVGEGRLPTLLRNWPDTGLWAKCARKRSSGWPWWGASIRP